MSSVLEVSYHPEASIETLKSARFYERRRRGLGTEFFDALDSTVQELQNDPMRHAADSNGVRSWRLRRFPFRVFYAVDADRIRILAVAHLSRQPGYWQRRIDD